jgi:MOSC domain-containing protein YiiM
MKLLSLQVGMPKKIGNAHATDCMETEWESAIFKDPVTGSVFANQTGLVGDQQADLEHHGGPDKAINSYPWEHFLYWKKKLGLDCRSGAFGENFTTQGLTEEEIFIGDIFKIGGITVQVTQPRQPCWKLAWKWKIKSLAALVQKTGRTGWYFRILEEGLVGAPDEFRLLERPHPKWSITLANDIMHNQKNDWDAAYQLGLCPALSKNWKTSLLMRAKKRRNTSEESRLFGK